MRTHRHDPIAVPLGHVEKPRPSRERSHLLDANHGTRQPIPILAEGEHIDWPALDIPTVTRRKPDRVELVRLYLLERLGIDDADAAREIAAIFEFVAR